MTPTDRFTSNSMVERGDRVAVEEIDGDLLMAAPEAGDYYGISATAKRIWELLEQPVTVDELCAKLASEYDGDLEEIRREALEFLGELLHHGLIRVVETKS